EPPTGSALALYRGWGFAEVERRADYYGGGADRLVRARRPTRPGGRSPDGRRGRPRRAPVENSGPVGGGPYRGHRGRGTTHGGRVDGWDGRYRRDGSDGERGTGHAAPGVRVRDLPR